MEQKYEDIINKFGFTIDTTLRSITGTGTVTSVSVQHGNGFNGTVSNATTTPLILISTDVVGIPLGDGTRFDSITVPANATQFLNGAATPVYAQVKDSDLSLSDITTNNVSSSQHGFISKYPNNTTTFFRGDGTYATIPAASITYKNGTTTKNSADASTTQNIPHGLGQAPAIARIWMQSAAGSAGEFGATNARAVYNGSTQSSQSLYYNGSAKVVDNSFSLNVSGSNVTTGVITVDATNIIITWTKAGAPVGTYQLSWETNT